MSKKRKLLEKILTGTKNVSFDDMVTLIQAFGFRLSRINGSHHIFIRSDIPEPINIQDFGGKAKPYQVKQFLQLIEQYNLQLGE